MFPGISFSGGRAAKRQLYPPEFFYVSGAFFMLFSYLFRDGKGRISAFLYITADFAFCNNHVVPHDLSAGKPADHQQHVYALEHWFCYLIASFL